MKQKKILTLCTLPLLFSFSLLFSQTTLELKNSNLERLNPEGKFWWWKNQAKNDAQAIFSVEDFDTNPGSTKSLKVETQKLGDKGWFLSTQFNQKFKGDIGESVKVTFYAKNASGNAKIKLVVQSDVQGSFQGKDFILTEDWTMYTHNFTLKSKSKQTGIKFWFMTAGTTYLLDDISISK